MIAMSACMLMIEAPSATADAVSEELAEMRVLVEQLKGQVDAQSEQIEHQGEVIREARLEQAQLGDSRFGASGIAAFLQRLEIEGWVAGSYFWNFNDPGSSEIVGGNSGISEKHLPVPRQLQLVPGGSGVVRPGAPGRRGESRGLPLRSGVRHDGLHARRFAG